MFIHLHVMYCTLTAIEWGSLKDGCSADQVTEYPLGDHPSQQTMQQSCWWYAGFDVIDVICRLVNEGDAL